MIQWSLPDPHAFDLHAGWKTGVLVGRTGEVSAYRQVEQQVEALVVGSVASGNCTPTFRPALAHDVAIDEPLDPVAVPVEGVSDEVIAELRTPHLPADRVMHKLVGGPCAAEVQRACDRARLVALFSMMSISPEAAQVP